MSSYIYTMYAGADPSRGWVMNDPIFKPKPTLGSCVPHIRRNVKVGDWVFVISGRVDGEKQYVVGGLSVAEKISQIAAASRFPEYQVRREGNQVVGNIIVDSSGARLSEDNHTNFERRIENFLVGDDAVFLESANEFARSKEQTLTFLGNLFGREGNRPFDIIGRGRSMSAEQAQEVRGWLTSMKDLPDG